MITRSPSPFPLLIIQMCKLLMYGSIPEAFDQFDLHLRTFLPLQGTIELIEFEHWAFMAKQFDLFLAPFLPILFGPFVTHSGWVGVAPLQTCSMYL